MYISIHKESKKKIECNLPTSQGVLATFDCRNLEIVDWDSQGQLAARAEDSSTVFEKLDLSDLWTDYDEATQNNCQIDKLTYSFERSKIK